MENRIEQKMQQLKQKGKKAFITYMMAGHPDMEKCKSLIQAQEHAGVDVLELGIPFSDPVADGAVIQDASYRCLAHGVNLKKVFALTKELRGEGTELAIVFRMYYNTALHFGLEKFVEECILNGVDGIVIPDLPLEEQGELKRLLEKERAPLLIQMASPMSGERLPRILKGAKGFAYCETGSDAVGQSESVRRESAFYLAQVKQIAKIPVMMEVEQAGDASCLKDVVDGVIVRAGFISLLEENNYNQAAVIEYCAASKRMLEEF